MGKILKEKFNFIHDMLLMYDDKNPEGFISEEDLV